MLSFYVLNVGHGSSVVVEYESHQGPSYGVIDSNARSGQTPKALTKLNQLGAKHLSFVALTHPHQDHFSGLYSIISAFPNAIDCFYSCPFGDLLHNQDRLKKLATGLQKIVKQSDGLDERQAALEMAQILWWAHNSTNAKTLDWHECKGEEFSIAPSGFSNVQISTMLPPSRVINNYITRIANEDMSVLGRFDDNEISLAFKLVFKGRCVLFGGDGTIANWRVRRRYEERKSERLSGDAVNLPHHGSKIDCAPEVLEQLFSETNPRYGITSADGVSHPNIEVVE
jgi:beta-lactamase superfamily II metal-dependent hydrolase